MGDNLIVSSPSASFAASQEPARFVRWQDGLAIYQLRPVKRAPVRAVASASTLPDNVIGEAALIRRPRASSIAP